MDQMRVQKFGMLAHSAGAPYAMATALHVPERVLGRIHLLCPWVDFEAGGGESEERDGADPEIDTSLAAYKWLKYVPNSVIKTAQEAEWKFQGWMLGKPPIKGASVGIGHDAGAHSSYDAASGTGAIGGRQLVSVDMDVPRTAESPNQPLRLANVHAVDYTGIVRESEDTPHTSTASGPRHKILSTAGDLETLLRSPTTRPVSSCDSQPRNETSSFVRALLQASHAEALSGGTADLLTILGKASKPWGFSHEDVGHPCKIMWGELDDKISESSMRRLEREMTSAQLTILPGQGHNLMTSSTVMVDVMESLAADASGFLRVKR